MELIGLYLIAAGLLVVAGTAKAVRPDDTARAFAELARVHTSSGMTQRRMRAIIRVGAFVEAALGVLAIAFPRPATAGLVASSYAVFGGIVLYVRIRGGVLSSCGCFGRTDTAATTMHALIDFLLAGAGVAVALGARSGGSIVTILGHQPARGIPLVFVSAVGLFMAYLALALLPALEGARRPMGQPLRSSAPEATT